MSDGQCQQMGSDASRRKPDVRLAAAEPQLLVLSSLFPYPQRPLAGVFIQERMFRVARHMPAIFVVPVPWFPLQWLIRRFRPRYRPPAPRREIRDGREIHYPRFLSFPGILKSLDGLFMALAVSHWWRSYKAQVGTECIVDAHFGYPDGVAAMLFATWHSLSYTVTLRGNEFAYFQHWWCRLQLRRVLKHASRIFTVSKALGKLAQEHGAKAGRILVVPNGVDARRFRPLDRAAARRNLGLPAEAPIIITVGWLIERKGHHRVIESLPELLQRFPKLIYLIVGEELNEPGWEQKLLATAQRLDVSDHVRLLGAMPAWHLAEVLSASDVFVLATRREGWANVLLEAMGCGLPVVATDIPGNGEIITDASLGTLVPFGDSAALTWAIGDAISRRWDRQKIVNYARKNGWDERVEQLTGAFRGIAEESLKTRAQVYP